MKVSAIPTELEIKGMPNEGECYTHWARDQGITNEGECYTHQAKALACCSNFIWKCDIFTSLELKMIETAQPVLLPL